MASSTVSDEVRPGKSAKAFRTISEVAEELQVAQHVLRFWESKFPQVKPLKRGGGRRYYRPEDVVTLKEIQALLYAQGYTIKGAQKLMKQRRGTNPVADELEPQPSDEAMPAVDVAIEPPPNDQRLMRLRTELQEIRAQLDGLLQ